MFAGIPIIARLVLVGLVALAFYNVLMAVFPRVETALLQMQP